jgi:UDP-hydrolysing UDP-N-acetyl-D-glucosamine 2-epimerase
MAKTKRVIAVFTGNRAEYGLQFPILKAIDAHEDLDYRLIVSGAHLDANFGRTLDEIRSDGFEIAAEVKIDLPEDNLFGTARAIGSGVLSMSDALESIRPDMLVVYADRFEGFAAVIAGTQSNTPTAHVEGGDITEGGALDDSVRHAMTKLAHLHFTTNEQSTARILAMGEEEWRVHTVGFPVIDLIGDGNYASPDELASQFGIDPDRPIVVFTQHSVTTEYQSAVAQLAPSLEAIGRLASEGVQVLATYPNNDAGGRRIIDELTCLRDRGLDNVQVRPSIGRYAYHGILALAHDPGRKVACVGNSSSGIKETPAFMCPAVNIGSRQDGRLRGDNIIDAGYDAEAIYDAVRRCFDDEMFRRTCRETANPYGTGGAGPKIAETLARVALDNRLLNKKMTLRGERNGEWFR